MSRESDRLEHLFSRRLDGECTPAERALLEKLARDNPHVREEFEAYRELEQLLGSALRTEMGRPQPASRTRTAWRQVGRTAALAVAACIAAIAWLQPGMRPAAAPRGRQPAHAQSIGPWFAPARPAVDVVEPVPSAYERPELRVRGTQRDWIVIPGDQPGSYYVIEVDRERTHVIPVRRDF
jgi:hypothetical protein